MTKTDLVLLHAPSVYDFRTKAVLHGPVSDVVPSTQIFEMYPIGFLTILEYLQRHGHPVRIVNVALKMLRNPRFDAERLIKSLKPVAFGLDLHWLVHAQGSLELAAIIKRHHPDIPVVFGGLSASYYHEELVRYPQVDYCIRGDSAEEPLRRLLVAIKEGRRPNDVPNLTWKDGSRVRVNELSHVPSTFDGVSFDYGNIMRSSARHRDLVGHLPFKTWFRYPIVGMLSSRGCVNNCAICGGSASAYRKICGRTKPAYPDAEVVAREVGSIARCIRGPIMIQGDIVQAGEHYVRDLLAVMKKEKVKNHVAFEFFLPPGRRLLEMIGDSLPNFNFQISPESHDERIRKAFGRAYDNEVLEESIADALELGCKRIDIFFMIGIPEQTPQSVLDTVGYCEDLLVKYCRGRHRGQLHPFISPLAPFLDPGSPAFEEPERHGYRLFCRTLEEHRRALLAPSWKHRLNYETRWMSRDELVEVTYEAALVLNGVKRKYGLVAKRESARIAARITQERLLIREMDTARADRAGGRQARRLHERVMRFDTVGPSTICSKNEMNWPAGFIRFNPLRIIRRAFAR